MTTILQGAARLFSKTAAANKLQIMILVFAFSVCSAAQAANPVRITVKTNSGITAPAITAGTALGNISACQGTPSAAPLVQQFAFSATNLTDNVIIKAPANFQVSLSASGGYVSRLQVTPAGGIVGKTTVYVRSAAAAPPGTISGSVSLTSPAAGSVQVAVNGVVSALPVVNAVANQTVNNGAYTAAVNFSGTAGVYSWVNHSPGIGLPARGQGNIPSFKAVNKGSSPVTASITVTPVTNAGFAYIANSSANTVSVVNTATNTVVATIPTRLSPTSVSVSPDSSRVYVVCVQSNEVSVINTATDTVITNITGFYNPWGIVVSPDGKKAYVGNRASGTVSVVSTATNQIVANIPVPTAPYGLAVSPDGTRLYVTNDGSDVSVINTATNAVIATISVDPTGSHTYDVRVSPDGKLLYVTNIQSDNISVISTATNTVTAVIGLNTLPYALTISPDGSRLYVVEPDSSNVAVINTVTDTVAANIRVGLSPAGVSVSPDGATLYVANTGSNNVSVINTSTNAVTGVVNTGNGPVSNGNFVTGGLTCKGAPITFSITINPANKIPLTVTANNQYAIQGKNLPPLTLTYSGFVDGDTPDSLTTLPVASTTATSSSAQNYYPITVSGGHLLNILLPMYPAL